MNYSTLPLNTYTLILLAFVGFFFAPVFSQGCLDGVAVYEDNGTYNIIYSRGDETVEATLGNGGTLSSPQDFNNNFTGLSSWEKMDACATLEGSKMIMFNGRERAYVDGRGRRSDAAPTLIDNGSLPFSELPPDFQDGIDAAFTLPTGQTTKTVYLFKGNRYVEMAYNQIFNWGFAPFTPVVKTGGFGAVFTLYFTDGIDAAFYYPPSELIYFFSGEDVIAIHAQNKTVRTGFPKKIVNWVLGFPSTWSCMEEVDNGDCQINFHIPDESCGRSSELAVNVSGVDGTAMGTDVTLEGVKLWIDHPFISDVSAKLVSPSGVEVQLIGSIGGGTGNDMGTSCTSTTYFTESATGFLSSGSAPYVGSFKPAGLFADFDDNSDPNGTWTLVLCDELDSDLGTLQYVELVFQAPTTSVADAVEPGFGATVFPNPTSGNLQLNIVQDQPGKIQLNVVDQVGRRVHQEAFSRVGTEFNRSLDLTHLPEGMYFIHLRSRQKRLTERVIVQR